MEKKGIEALERQARAKALLLSSAHRDWSTTQRLLTQLGDQAWRRRDVMGQTPEEAGFEAVWVHGSAPEHPMLTSTIAGQIEFAALEERALNWAKQDRPSADKSRGALGWLAELAPVDASDDMFEDWTVEGTKAWPEMDLGAWAETIARRAREGSLGPSWRGNSGFYGLVGTLCPAESKLVGAALADAGLLLPLHAAASGASAVVREWIEDLAPEAALALLMAQTCGSSDDWEQFERIDPTMGTRAAKRLGIEGRDGQESWRALACYANAQPQPWDFERLKVGSSHSELALDKGSDNAIRRWEEAIANLARRASLVLNAESESEVLMGLRKFVSRISAPAVRAICDPNAVESWDFSGMDQYATVDELRELAHNSVAGLTRVSIKAAEHLWMLRSRRTEEINGTLRTEHGWGIGKAVKVLWEEGTPEAFEAFIQCVSRLEGSPQKGAILCDVMLLLGRAGRSAPASAGHLIALGRTFPPAMVDAQGEKVWRDGRSGCGDLFASVWEAMKMGALLQAVDAGDLPGWSLTPPEMLPGIEEWGALDLSEPKWRPKAKGAQAVAGWEGAMQAVCALALASGAWAQSKPPEPKEQPVPDDPPSRCAWRLYAQARPEEAASRLCRLWRESEDGANVADRIAQCLSPSECEALAPLIVVAFEKENKYRHLKVGAAESCRRAARALTSESDSAFSDRDVLCSELMAASSFGIAMNLRESSHWVDDKKVEVDALALGECLPQAALTITARANRSDILGFSSRDLAAKAAWGALALAAAYCRNSHPHTSFAQAWAGVEIDPESQWSGAMLSAIFTCQARGHMLSVATELVRQASAWLRPMGVDGLGRLEGSASAIELAVECRPLGSRDERGCFGEEVVAVLVGLGADPSDPEAKDGQDALALCAQLDRAESPSSVMRVLLKSPKATPGRGDLWGIVSAHGLRGKSNLSDKLHQEIVQKAMNEPHMSGMIGLTKRGNNKGPVNALMLALSKSDGARALATQGLVGAIAEQYGKFGACLMASRAMKERNIEKSPSDSVKLFECAIRVNLDSVDGFEFMMKMKGWIEAGAKPMGVKTKSLRGNIDWDQAIAGAKLGPEPALADLIAARAALVFDEDRQPIGTAVRALANALELDHLGFGSARFAEVASLVVARARQANKEGHLNTLLGSEGVASLERCLLIGLSSRTMASSGKKNRL